MQARLIGSITLALLILLTLATGPALAGDSCSVRQARREMVKARAEYREAVRVYEATKRYTRTYGKNVGRWTWLSRDVGWPWSQLDYLMYVVNRESRGQPGVVNPTSGCTGLLQLHPCHGVKNAKNPRVNLRAGLRLWKKAGWSPWAL